MGVKKWISENAEAIMGVEVVTAFVLLPVVIILQGVSAENIIDKGLWYFLGVGTSVIAIVIVKGVFSAKGGNR